MQGTDLRKAWIYGTRKNATNAPHTHFENEANSALPDAQLCAPHFDGHAAIGPSVLQSEKCTVFLASSWSSQKCGVISRKRTVICETTQSSLQVHRNFRKCAAISESALSSFKAILRRKSLMPGKSAAHLKPKRQKVPQSKNFGTFLHYFAVRKPDTW